MLRSRALGSSCENREPDPPLPCMKLMRWMCAVVLMSSCTASFMRSGSIATAGGGTGGGTTGSYGAPQTSQSVPAEDAAIIIPPAQSFMKDCGDCVAPGFDFRAGTVAVSGEDKQMRAKWLEEIYDPNGAEHSSYADVLKRCEWATPPEIQIDMAVVKFWQVNKLAPPMQNVFNGFADTCGNPPDPAVKALVQK